MQAARTSVVRADLEEVKQLKQILRPQRSQHYWLSDSPAEEHQDHSHLYCQNVVLCLRIPPVNQSLREIAESDHACHDETENHKDD